MRLQHARRHLEDLQPQSGRELDGAAQQPPHAPRLHCSQHLLGKWWVVGSGWWVVGSKRLARRKHLLGERDPLGGLGEWRVGRQPQQSQRDRDQGLQTACLLATAATAATAAAAAEG